MKAHQLFSEIFSKENLTRLYEEKISRSPVVGRDGIRMRVFEDNLDEEISLILTKVGNKSYKFTGYKQKLISKGAQKCPRLLSIPTFRDRLTLRALCDLISEVFGDSKTKPPHRYIKEIKQIIDQHDQSYCFLRIDIKDYYPTISQEILLRCVRSRIRKKPILDILQKALKTPTGKSNTLSNENIKGIPQGLSISNILSAIYLRNLDRKYQQKTNYFRYVDDILVICKETEAGAIFKSLKSDLRRSKLECHPLSGDNPDKTKKASFSEGLNYLGYHIAANNVSVRESSYQRMFTNLLKVFTQYKYTKNRDQFLWRLNLRVTGCVYETKRLGWMFFFSQTENKSQLVRLDKFVKELVGKYQLKVVETEIKTFIRTFHEIRYSQTDSKYIPHFDSYTQDQKIATICLHNRKLTAELVGTWELQRIDSKFWKLISRETSNLEEDLIGAFS